MKQIAQCTCGAKSGMHLTPVKGKDGTVTGHALKGSCVICGKELDARMAQTIRGPSPVPEPELDLLEIG